MKVLAAIGLVAMIGPLQPGAAHASTNGEWSLEPASAEGTTGARSFFDYSIGAGQAVQDMARLANLTDHELTFNLYAADAYTTPEGGFALRLQDAPRTGVGSWVSMTTSTVTVAAGTAITFPIQIGVPADASPGDWAGGIVASVATPPDSASGQPGLAIEQGVAARIYLRVEGPLDPAVAVTALRLDLGSTSWAPLGHPARARVSYDVANTGNVRLSGTAQLELTDTAGRTLRSFPDQRISDLLPHEHLTITEAWDGLPLTGLRYDARVVVVAGGVSSASTSPARWHVPVLVPLAIVVVVSLVAVAVRRILGSVSRRRSTGAAAAVRS